jgi:uncharacterized paraquat-inducible protein A
MDGAGVPKAGATTVSDPEFEALLDKMAEEMESEEDDVPIEKHDWKVARALLYECDDSSYECGKCGVKLRVKPRQSLNAAMEEQKVLVNCAEQCLLEVSRF